MRQTRKLIMILVGICALASMVYAAPTDPTGPSNIVVGPGERLDPADYPFATVQAEAGNITQLNITATVQTQTWQGYYGSVTGTITLDDADSNTLYDWVLVEPQGEIYASNGSTVTWANIKCVNYTAYGNDTEKINLTILETMYGLDVDDMDG